MFVLASKYSHRKIFVYEISMPIPFSDFEVYTAHYIWRGIQSVVYGFDSSNTTEHVIPLPLHIFSVGVHTCLVAQTFFGTLISDLIPIFFCIGCISR